MDNVKWSISLLTGEPCGEVFDLLATLGRQPGVATIAADDSGDVAGGFAATGKQELRGDGHAVVPSHAVGALRWSMA